jgi:hypothetical protein
VNHQPWSLLLKNAALKYFQDHPRHDRFSRREIRKLDLFPTPCHNFRLMIPTEYSSLLEPLLS